MARPLHIAFKGAWYHAMNRGAADRRSFIALPAGAPADSELRFMLTT
jgi:hypothetical protein